MSRATNPHRRAKHAWSDPKVGLTGLRRFQQKLQERNVSLSADQIKRLLRQQPEYALLAATSPQRRAQARRGNTIVESGVCTGLQMDLMDVSLLATRNQHYRWILTVIDVYSRYAWAVPVKRKTQENMCAAIDQVLKQAKRVPQRVTSDNGKEFLNAKVQDLLRSLKIKHYTTQVGDKHTTGIIERFNRTLRELMGRNFVRAGKLHWVHDLPSLLHNYNASMHSTIRERPIDVWTGKVRPRPRYFHREVFPYVPGQVVRLRLTRGIFEKKSGAQQWSSSIYTIVRREGFKYKVKNEQGEELKTKYRPIDLSPVPVEVVQRIREERNIREKQNLEHHHQKAQQAKRTKSYMKRHGLVPSNLPRLRRTSARKRRRMQ